MSWISFNIISLYFECVLYILIPRRLHTSETNPSKHHEIQSYFAISKSVSDKFLKSSAVSKYTSVSKSSFHQLSKSQTELLITSLITFVMVLFNRVYITFIPSFRF